jgi:lauroyl/myristoyl acyltransferase
VAENEPADPDAAHTSRASGEGSPDEKPRGLGLGARATYLAYRAGGVIGPAIPAAVARPLATGVGRVLLRAMSGRRAMAARHLSRASGGALRGPELEAAVAGTFDSYARYWLEMFRLPHARTAEVEANIDVVGYEHIEAGLAAGRGVILALPHLGGWEYAGVWVVKAKGNRLLVVVEPVEPPELFEWFVRVRAAMGMDVVALGPEAASASLRALRDNWLLALVCDRDLRGDGVEVEFFGEKTTMPAGPAMLALRGGAVIVPVAVYFRPQGGHHAVVRPPLDTTRRGSLRDDVARITQDLAREFEGLIAAEPQQWHLLQPNWPSDHLPGDHQATDL